MHRTIKGYSCENSHIFEYSRGLHIPQIPYSDPAGPSANIPG